MTRGTTNVGIIGAGVAGLTCAIALERAGFRAHVFEQAKNLREGGGALESIGLRRPLCSAPTAQIVETSEFRDDRGDYITSIPVGDLGRKHGAETIFVSRTDLLQTLRNHLPEGVKAHFDHRVLSFSEAPDGVMVQFSNGIEHRFDALIGADGIHSTVRGLLGLDTGLRRTPQDLWIGMAEHADRDLVPGHNVATVGVSSRFWYTVLGDGRVFWYAPVPEVGPRGPVTTLPKLRDLFAKWHPPIPAILEATTDDEAFHTPMRDRPPSLPWGTGRVTLMGDAAHSMTPDMGQGACQAIESAIVLPRHLGAEPDVPRALRAYERERFLRTSDITRMSWLMAQTSTAAGPVSATLRNAGMRFGMRAMVMSQLDWLFEGPA
jgi:2-polyprenyl-6-methoxyphenol hydroxylase-like FAD-dependent oxidoreductase